jgi:FkbM family methyltransferase
MSSSSDSTSHATPNKSYSQWNQDIVCADLLATLFQVTETGFYADVGACDGRRISNTYLFSQKPGWRGICVEPHPIAFQQLQRNRDGPRDVLFNVAASSETGTVPFRVIEGYALELSGIENEYDPRHIARIHSELETMGGKSYIVNVPTRKLDDMLDEAGAPQLIDFLSVDVEGGELGVLQGFIRHDAKVVTIENNYKDANPCRAWLEGRGYQHVRTCGGDDIYILKA